MPIKKAKHGVFVLFSRTEKFVCRSLFDHIELLIMITASHALVINSQTGDLVDSLSLTGMYE